jgi:hypothetical protein
MRRVLATVAALGAVALALTTSAYARSTTTVVTSCPSTAVVIANVTYPVAGDPVTGRYGNVWATASYTRTLVIYRVSRTTYCALWRDSGTFVTVAADPSPGGTGSVGPGIVGTATRTAVTTNFTATWQPAGATSGSIAAQSVSSNWLSLYFTNVQGYGTVWNYGMYSTPANGCWGTRTGYPSIGDVTGV